MDSVAQQVASPAQLALAQEPFEDLLGALLSANRSFTPSQTACVLGMPCSADRVPRRRQWAAAELAADYMDRKPVFGPWIHRAAVSAANGSYLMRIAHRISPSHSRHASSHLETLSGRAVRAPAKKRGLHDRLTCANRA